MLDFTSQCWISPRSSGLRPARPVGSARAVPAPPSARGAHQMARHAQYPRRPRRVALTRWLGTRCTRAALGAWRSPDGSARAVPAPPSARGAHQMARHALYPRRPRRVALTRWLGTRCTRAALGTWRSPDGSAHAVPAPPSARGAHQMARHVLPRDLLAERTEVPFGRYGKGRRRAVFRMCRPCFRIIILALKDFAFHRSEAKSHVQPRKNSLSCR